MAESETYAHLEHLRLAGHADSHWEDDKLFYDVNCERLRPTRLPPDDRCRWRRAPIATRTPQSAVTVVGSTFAAAHHHHDPLARLGPVGPRPHRRQRRRAAGLGHQPHRRPQRALRVADGVVGHQHGVVDERRRHGEGHGPDGVGPQRVGGEATDGDRRRAAGRAGASYIAGIGAGSTLTMLAPGRRTTPPPRR